MKRFLSELWSTDCHAPAASFNAPGRANGANHQIRSLASKLISPTSSESEGEVSPRPCLPKTLKPSSSIHDRDVQLQACLTSTSTCDPIARKRKNNGGMVVQKHVRGKVRSSALCPNEHDRYPGYIFYSLVCDESKTHPLPNDYCFGTTVTVGKRAYDIPHRTYVDWSPLASFQVSELVSLPGIKLKLILNKERCIFAGVWHHCVDQVEKLVFDFNDICVFKIGITANVSYRNAKYRESNFSEMRLIHCSNDADLAALLEMMLIAQFRDRRGCRNIAKGGDGSMVACNRFGPYFVYCVGARADGNKAIGS